ncbi:MAG: hypothetical protein K9G60_14855 [Pseudolabrys sp.]|nr:hypothetical protein [Pseudolabrys sp.]
MTRFTYALSIASLFVFAAAALVNAEPRAKTPEDYLQEFAKRLAIVNEISALPHAGHTDLAGCIQTVHNSILQSAFGATKPGVTLRQFNQANLCAAARMQVECAKRACKADVRSCTDVSKFEKIANRTCIENSK